MKWILFFVSTGAVAWAARPGGYSFDPSHRIWTLRNGSLTAKVELTPDGVFQLDQIISGTTVWQAPTDAVCSPLRFAIDGRIYDGSTHYTLVEQHTEGTGQRGMRQVIVLADTSGTVEVQVNLETFNGQPVLRFRNVVTNRASNPVTVTMADMLPLTFADAGAPFQAFAVDQWAVVPTNLNFGTSQVTLSASTAAPLTVHSGAHGTQTSWLALRNTTDRGLFAGWEFNGRSAAYVSDSASLQKLQFSAAVDGLNHPLAPGASFAIPPAFVGFFQGDWDEAGYRTQRFVEAVLARPVPDVERFPYMSWDSWGFLEQVDEATLRRNALLASQLGVELFIVDLGWANQIGDWHPDPAKFPNGMKVLSDYVHSLGMKFGLHLTPAEAAPTSPLLTAHPDWTSSENDNYFNSASLCLSHAPVKAWVASEIVRVIDDYGVDWILQDGENMVKNCVKTTHTHHPADSNYANSVEGIDWVVEEVLRQRPAVSWENCENGGNMMTFKMVQNYVTSITNDASGALGSRQGVYGATYPFSPRYADRYSPEDPVKAYNAQSYMFGGPWHLMTQLDPITPDQVAFAAAEIAAYKKTRKHIRDGKVFHLTPAPGTGSIDAIESSYAGGSAVVAIVTREGGTAAGYILKLRGVPSGAVYQVHFQNDSRVLSMSGQQLANDGVLVTLPDTQSSEIVYADRQ